MTEPVCPDQHDQHDQPDQQQRIANADRYNAIAAVPLLYEVIRPQWLDCPNCHVAEWHAKFRRGDGPWRLVCWGCEFVRPEAQAKS